MDQSIQNQSYACFSISECETLYKTVNFALVSLGNPLSYPETYNEIGKLRSKLYHFLEGKENKMRSPILAPVEEMDEPISPLDLNLEKDNVYD